MNKQRRTELDALIAKVAALGDRVSELLMEVAAITEELTELESQEQDYYDNMPEGIQNGSKGAQVSEGLSALGDAREKLAELENVLNDFDSADVQGQLKLAKGA